MHRCALGVIIRGEKIVSRRMCVVFSWVEIPRLGVALSPSSVNTQLGNLAVMWVHYPIRNRDNTRLRAASTKLRLTQSLIKELPTWHNNCISDDILYFYNYIGFSLYIVGNAIGHTELFCHVGNPLISDWINRSLVEAALRRSSLHLLSMAVVTCQDSRMLRSVLLWVDREND